MFKRILLSLCWVGVAAAASLPSPPALAQAEKIDPRVVTQQIAAAIEENFYDEGRGAEIAADLRAEATAGDYDALTEPYALASALSRRLAPLDGHFRVNWDGPKENARTSETADADPRAEYSWPDLLRRNGHGFAQAKVLPGNLGYIEMSNFAMIDFDDPEDPARRTADGALAMTAEADALIIDLRDNGGGAPDMVGYLVSAFTPADADIYNVFHARDGTTSEAPAIFYSNPDLDRPLYVLTSARTASAAEAFAYTLQAAERATVVGEITAGGANPGGDVETESGFTVFVSFGSPINAVTGGNWEGTGVHPDVAVSAEDALDEAQRLALGQVVDGERAQTDSLWALEALQAKTIGAHAEWPELERYAGDYGGYRLTVDHGKLRLQRGRRPARTLLPLGGHSFYDADKPTTRYRFFIEGVRAVALEAQTVYGSSVRELRTAE